MRVCLITWTNRQVGGVETYLSKVIPGLAHAGCEVGFWYEKDSSPDREPISLQMAKRTWGVEQIGRDRALAGLRDWQPDVLYSHGLLDPELEAQILEVIRDMLASPFETRLSVKDITSWFIDRHGMDYERKVTGKWVGSIIRRKLQLKTERRGGEFIIPESERSKLQGLYERYGISPQQADGPDTAEKLS